MSVRTLATVWECSQQSGTHLLLLLAIADFSDDEGQAFPAVATLAQKCRMGSRNVQTLLAALRASGELEVLEGKGPRGANLFRIRLEVLKTRHSHGSKLSRTTKGAKREATEDAGLGVQRLAGVGVQGLAGVGVQSLAGVGVQRLAHRGAKPCAAPISMNRHEPVEAQRPPEGVASTPRGVRLPEGWQLPEDWREWCAKHRPDLDPQATAEAFSDYWHAKPGKDAAKLDWFATWRNWCRNQRQQPGPRASAVGSGSAGRVLSSDHVFTLGGDE